MKSFQYTLNLHNLWIGIMITLKDKHIFTPINGKALANNILLDLKMKIQHSGIRPGLAVILIGDNPSSMLYVKNKEKASQRIGIDFYKYLCNKDCLTNISDKEIIEMIHFLNGDPTISGIIVQLPIPKKYDTKKIIGAISPKKDADGFHPKNIKDMLSGKSKNFPPLIQTILSILENQKIHIGEKRVLIITKSDMFQLVIIKAFKNLHARVQALDPKDKKLKEKLKEADIIIPIIGKPKFIKGNMIKKDAVIIDVGITKTQRGYEGDADFESIKKVASSATPTPGGVGPVTVAMLLKTVFEMAQKKISPS